MSTESPPTLDRDKALAHAEFSGRSGNKQGKAISECVKYEDRNKLSLLDEERLSKELAFQLRTSGKGRVGHVASWGERFLGKEEAKNYRRTEGRARS